MSSAIMVSLTVMCEDDTLVLKITESISRVSAGLALEGLHVSLTLSTVEYDEVEQEQEQQ